VTTTDKVLGRGWAKTGAALGGVVSICANVAHSFVPPAHASASWTPQPGAVVGAVVWPVFLFIAIEILTSTRWPSGAAFNLVRWGGLLPVTLVAAFVSYRHLAALLAYYGEDSLVVHLGPLAVDGLMAMATGALIATSTRYIQPPTTPVDTTPTVAAPTVAALTTNPQPPVLPDEDSAPEPKPARPRAPRKTAAAKATPAAKKTAAKKATSAPRTADTPAVTAVATDPLEQAVSPAERHPSVPPAPSFTPAPSTHDIPVRAVHAAEPVKSSVPAGLLTRARVVTDAIAQATDEPITPGMLAVGMRIDTRLASALLDALDLPSTSPRPPVLAANGSPNHT
jgi:hypothetical protein